VSAVELADLPGLWRRTLIAWPDGRSDAASEVMWLQSLSAFADLRIPPGRPERGDASCLRQLDWEMLGFLAQQEGFIGHLEVSGSIGHWHRRFDYQPNNGIADRGILELAGEVLIERGIDLPYTEHWVRETQRPAPAMALELATATALPIGVLVAVGDAFIYARSRAAPLPRNTTLRQLLGAAGSLATAQDLFDCEISFGHIAGGDWRIERSSLPFREGQSLAPSVTPPPPALLAGADPAGGTLVIDDVAPDGAAIKRAWHISRYEGNRPFRDWFAATT